MRTSLVAASLGFAAVLPLPAEVVVIPTGGAAGGLAPLAVDISFDATGAASAAGAPLSVLGTTTEGGAFGATLGLVLDPIKNVSTTPATLGDKLAAGTLDRDGNSLIGVSGNPNGGGIGADAENREGIAFLLDATGGIDPSLEVRLNVIRVRNVGRDGIDPVGTESFSVIHPGTRQSLDFAPTSGLEGWFDVSGLGLSLQGGTSGPVAVIASGDVGGFRVAGLSLDVAPTDEGARQGAVGERGISYVSGDIVRIDPPPASMQPGAAERWSRIQLVTEKQSVTLDEDVAVDHLVDGPVTIGSAPPAPGVLPTGVTLSSHYLHADLPPGAPPAVLFATITFESPVVGLAWTSLGSGDPGALERTDAMFAPDGTIFAPGPSRGSGGDDGVDQFSIDASGRTLTVTFRLEGGDDLDGLRVITRTKPVEPPPAAPNIVVFLADDMGIGDTSAYQDWAGIADGAQIHTPAMERLADLGVRFTDAHAQNRCTPSRYALLTGRYAWRAGLLQGVLMGAQKDPLIDRGRPTLPAFLKGRGYSTGMVGKWHLGLAYRREDGTEATGWNDSDLRLPMRDGPLDHGFDFFDGFSRSHHTSGPDGTTNNTADQSTGPGWIRWRRVEGATGIGKQLTGTYLFDRIGQRLHDSATGFVADHLASPVGGTRPFFLWYASHANHTPYTPDPSINGVPVAGASRWKNGEATGSARHDFIHLNDVLLAELMAYLEDTDDPRNPGSKLIDNTLLIFTSDNGAEINDPNATGNLRAFKARIYEGGHRVPFLAWWKGGGIGDSTEDGSGGSTDALLGLQDLYPTFAEMLGSPLPAPESPGDPAVDGFSRWAALRGLPGPPRPPLVTNEQAGQTWLSLQYNGTVPVDPAMTGNWKVIFAPELLQGTAEKSGVANPLQLYELESDRGETHNLADSPAHQELLAWLSRWAERIVNGDGTRRSPPETSLRLEPADGGIRLRFRVEPFFDYELERSGNLLEWESIASLRQPQTADLDVFRAADSPREFFRIVSRQ